MLSCLLTCAFCRSSFSWAARAAASRPSEFSLGADPMTAPFFLAGAFLISYVASGACKSPKLCCCCACVCPSAKDGSPVQPKVEIHTDWHKCDDMTQELAS